MNPFMLLPSVHFRYIINFFFFSIYIYVYKYFILLQNKRCTGSLISVAMTSRFNVQVKSPAACYVPRANMRFHALRSGSSRKRFDQRFHLPRLPWFSISFFFFSITLTNRNVDSVAPGRCLVTLPKNNSNYIPNFFKPQPSLALWHFRLRSVSCDKRIEWQWI